MWKFLSLNPSIFSVQMFYPLYPHHVNHGGIDSFFASDLYYLHSTVCRKWCKMNDCLLLSFTRSGQVCKCNTLRLVLMSRWWKAALPWSGGLHWWMKDWHWKHTSTSKEEQECSVWRQTCLAAVHAAPHHSLKRSQPHNKTHVHINVAEALYLYITITGLLSIFHLSILLFMVLSSSWGWYISAGTFPQTVCCVADILRNRDGNEGGQRGKWGINRNVFVLRNAESLSLSCKCVRVCVNYDITFWQCSKEKMNFHWGSFSFI